MLFISSNASFCASCETRTESVRIYVIKPESKLAPSYSSCAIRIVLSEVNPNFFEASCCILLVVNGGGACLLLKRLLSLDTVSVPMLFVFQLFHALPFLCAHRLLSEKPKEFYIKWLLLSSFNTEAVIVQYSSNEILYLFLCLSHHACSDRLHTPGGQSMLYFRPKQGAYLIANQAVLLFCLRVNKRSINSPALESEDFTAAGVISLNTMRHLSFR